jgi:kynurenine formamidase
MKEGSGMSRNHFILLLVMFVFTKVVWEDSSAPIAGQVPASQAAPTTEAESLTLEDLISGRAKTVDLTYALNPQNAFWPGDNYQPFELKTLATLEKDGVLSKAICLPEHLGTHLDAPNHFERNQPSVDKLTAAQLFGPGVLIDIAAQAEQNADYTLSVKNIESWEHQHGRIPEGAIVLLHTGWGRFWNNAARFQNRDARGQLHFPSYSAQAARLLIDKRKCRGLGIDNLSIDPGNSKEFPVHHIVNAAGKFGLENVANLDQLPPRGFTLIVAPIKIESGTGGPARIWAILPKKSAE